MTDIKVAGMTCDHCVKAVTSELEDVAGVSNVQVSLNPEGPADVSFECTSDVTPDLIGAAVDEGVTKEGGIVSQASVTRTLPARAPDG
ncbi:MAG: cation transporter, partial [Planctomycetaceae bacterium]